ncbi:hypothetical protein Aple_099240 [Acrocarpospora pleiomorpha]|uniref:Uncharacterized protein n=1 Tax=Acrocarpospora pleiomorpha TaxID=90975 RepID=A0A5M3Y122_9ACTN|nr:hypothetical protein [Acrocarpospora pleiomorpha]GES27025.1 hypothetical protein Aple_099240 [Acrocarpospora pleiomorpha]
MHDIVLDGCPAYRVWVNAAPSLDEMIFGFEHDWRRSPSQQGAEPFHRLNGARPRGLHPGARRRQVRALADLGGAEWS